jgi:hypothetical protein
MTLEEIKAIVYPKDNVNMVDVVKELLKFKNFKEGELVTFDGIYMYDIGDSNLHLCGLAVINGNLICVTEEIYGGDVWDMYIGTIRGKEGYGYVPDEEKGIYLTDEAIKKVCQLILEDKTEIDFNFVDMKSFDGLNGDYFNGIDFEEYLEEHESAKEKIESFCNGTSVGCICY